MNTGRSISGSEKYARGFVIREEEGYTELSILDPWNQRDTFAVYQVLKPDVAIPDHLDKEKILRANPARWAIFSTTHVAYLDAFGEAERVIGCTTPDRLYHSALYDKYKKGDLIRIGSDMEYNYESLVNQQPDIIIQTGFAGQLAKDARIRQTGIDLVYVMEWLEPTPLGRAEWIKVFGLLLNMESVADSIFQSIEEDYLELKGQISDQIEHPKVLIGNSFKGTWFMPGGGNYMSEFLKDAGFFYPWYEKKESESLPLGFEAVVHEFNDAPFWLNVSARKLSDLTIEDPRYSMFRAFKEKEVYSLSNRMLRGLANDYWEGAIMQPHVVLADLIFIAHPEVLPNHKLVYYKKLQ